MPETQASGVLPGILADIVASKRKEVARLRGHADRLREAAEGAPPARDLLAALRAPESVGLIAECKRRSPGAGDIRPGLDPVTLARAYEAAGAAALSVLTDGPFFGGGNDDLEAIRAGTSLPVLRKDFTLDPVQVIEARAVGADAVLLIVRILDDTGLRALLDLAGELGMSALVEAHDGPEVERAVDAGARIVGINNRDLATFRTDLDTTLKLLDRVPPDVLVVSESGIRDADDVARLGRAGVDAVLVGESLLRSPDPERAAAALATAARSPRA